jgi:tRNA modification GTPase
MKSDSQEYLTSEDTIAAIATAAGRGAVGMVRISGPEAIEIAGRCFQHEKNVKNLPERHLTLGRWVHPQSGQTMDEVLLAVMRAPHSYTCEDVVEVTGHGGPMVLRQVLSAAIAAGARPAGPGEFTLRAFRSGRLDLTRAEAVAELVAAETEAARRLSLRALEGDLSKRIRSMKNEVLELLANLETHIEFPMEDVQPMPAGELLDRVEQVRQEVSALVEMAGRREVYRRGLYTVLTGRPNVGKSSLFNRILGRSRALVTAIPGTTRDTLEETVSLSGVELHLVDTAGGRLTDEEIEKLGVERTVDAARKADLVWFVTDAPEGWTAEDEQWLERIVPLVEQERTLLFLLNNKWDISSKRKINFPESVKKIFGENRQFNVSAETGEGLELFLEKVRQAASEHRHLTLESDLLVNARQEALFRQVLQAFERIQQAVGEQLSLDMVAMDLWEVKNGLDRLDGTSIMGGQSGDLLHEIFSRFCIGK